LRQFSRYAPTAIGVLPRLRPFRDQKADLGVVVAGLLGGLMGGLAALSHSSGPRASTVALGVGAVLGSIVGAWLGFTASRQGRADVRGSDRRKNVLVKVRTRDPEETANILRQHNGSLRSGSGAPFPSLHPLK
jgi:outer membrane lipoprotein SlyB